MDIERLGLILWIVSGCLMAAGVLGVGLALILGKSVRAPTEAARPVGRREAPAVAVRPQDAVRPKEVVGPPISEKALAARRAAYRLGVYVLIGLAVLTALEFLVASLLEGSVVFLFVLALAKAGMILQYFMHLNRVWGEEEAH
jgi:hypothetical protein